MMGLWAGFVFMDCRFLTDISFVAVVDASGFANRGFFIKGVSESRR